MTSLHVTAVIVAWNRAGILSDALDALDSQTRPVDAVVAVDNASTDDTSRVLSTHPVVSETVTMPRNMGGAGGFAAGMARALVRGTDLLWIMDDDTVPRPDALAMLLQAREDYPGTPALLAARADWIDGREHPMNAPRTRVGLPSSFHRHARAVGARQVRTSSFVAPLIDARAVVDDGLPIADYFLWNDDFEFTSRILRRRIGLYVPGARVEHRTKTFGNSTAQPGERLYNEVRNKMWTFTRSPALGTAERLAYCAATLRRWVGFLTEAPDRAHAMALVRRGVRVGLTPPRPNAEVLAHTPAAADVARIEGQGWKQRWGYHRGTVGEARLLPDSLDDLVEDDDEPAAERPHQQE